MKLTLLCFEIKRVGTVNHFLQIVFKFGDFNQYNNFHSLHISDLIIKSRSEFRL